MLSEPRLSQTYSKVVTGAVEPPVLCMATTLSLELSMALTPPQGSESKFVWTGVGEGLCWQRDEGRAFL